MVSPLTGASEPLRRLLPFPSTLLRDPQGPRWDEESLRGRMVFLLFFQSWCPSCGEWAGQFLSQIEKRYGLSPEIALVAIKTDGDVASARAFLTEKGADLRYWLLAADPGGRYHRLLLGEAGLWEFALVDPEGWIVRGGFVGDLAETVEPKRFVLMAQNLTDWGGQDTIPSLFIPPDGWREEDAETLRALKAGDYAEALASLARRREDPRTSNLSLHLSKTLQTYLTHVENHLRHAPPPIRYSDYRLLRSLVRGIEAGSTPPRDYPEGLSAPIASLSTLLHTLEKDPAIQRECAAEAAYRRCIEELARREKATRTSLRQALSGVAREWAGTEFGERAASEFQGQSRNEDAPYRLDPQRLDLGSLIEGEQKTFSLRLLAPPSAAISLGRLYSPCSCILVTAAKRDYGAGDPVSIEVTIDTKPLKEGAFSFPVYVQLCAPTRMILHANIAFQIHAKPRVIQE